MPDDAEKPVSLYTIALTDAQADTLRARLSGGGEWEPFSVAYARFAYKGDRVNVVCYAGGKTVIQGKRTAEFVADVLEPFVTGEARLGYDDVRHPEWFSAHAGLDESGKGDLFGPVVSACVVAQPDAVRDWLRAGVRDSKAVTSDAAIFKLEQRIRATAGATVKTLCFSMPKYNALYARFGGNLNRLLAWMHARTLETALAERPVPWGLLDQFCKEPLVQKQLRATPEGFELKMRTKAEEDPVVAAASICARAEFVRALAELSAEAGEPLLRGAGNAVTAQAKRLVARLGAERFGEFAKLHFRTAYAALGLPVPEKKVWRPYRREAGA